MKQLLNKTTYAKQGEKRLVIAREFTANLERVWQAWTDSKILDKWWAPKPWKTETKSLDFKVGGSWLYSMNGPEGERHWAWADFKAINNLSSYEMEEGFCDANGKRDENIPPMHWKVSFSGETKTTRVVIEIDFVSAEALAQVVQMGFQEGFAAAHENLDELLAIGGA